MGTFCALVLAAGKGTRMVSARAKVLHPVCGVPMIRLIHRAVSAAGIEDVIMVIGQDADRVRQSMSGLPCNYILQTEQLGTGHAVQCAAGELGGRAGSVLVVYGDMPRIRSATLRRLAEDHERGGSATTLLTVEVPDPHGYGRIIRAEDGSVVAIVEEKDATPEQRRIREINPGIYCFRIDSLLAALNRLSNTNAQREYYLTDIIQIQRAEGLRIEGLLHGDWQELQGVNSRRELVELGKTIGRQKNLDLMAAGVTIIDPDRTYVEMDVQVGRDVTLYPGVSLEGTTRIGDGTTVRAGTRITNSVVGPEAEILDSCVIVDSEVGFGSQVGPFSHLRPGTRVGERCRVGNFVEIKKSSIGYGSKASHLAYLGDAVIGAGVNIGAGVITCNYDGVQKNQTTVEDGAFVGTDSQLVAPVRVGKGAYVAAGSCITADVPAGSLAVARSRQVVKEGWVARKRTRRTAE
jgi:bifunctional UDP-N-acetylglucosamine pyrophosphorylase / glucosamine-1-phosphate N-acetyltransferase